jgi:hypothetical protein
MPAMLRQEGAALLREGPGSRSALWCGAQFRNHRRDQHRVKVGVGCEQVRLQLHEVLSGGERHWTSYVKLTSALQVDEHQHHRHTLLGHPLQ